MTGLRYRISNAARADILSILHTSETRHGAAARTRYRGLLSATFRRIALGPIGPLTKDRSELVDRLRSLHCRHCRTESNEAPVAEPVHVIFCRTAGPEIVEIVRVLHERMEPSRHLEP